MKKVLSLLASLVLLVGVLGASASVVAGVTACNQKVYVYDGLNATGNVTTLCAEDYPLLRAPGTGYSFDNGMKFNGTTISIDNRISSVKFDTAASPNVKIKFYSSYYYNAGNEQVITKTGVYPFIFNLNSTLNNAASSVAGCGLDCSDEPQN